MLLSAENGTPASAQAFALVAVELVRFSPSWEALRGTVSVPY